MFLIFFIIKKIGVSLEKYILTHMYNVYKIHLLHRITYSAILCCANTDFSAISIN